MSTATIHSKMQVKRTYGSRQNTFQTPPSASSLKKTPVEASSPRVGQKRPLADVLTPSLYNIPTPTKRTKHSTAKLKTRAKVKSSAKSKQKTLTQLHFAIDQTTLRTCLLCDLSYTKGAPEDESLHRSHCARVQRGMEWGKEEERESTKVGVIEIASQVKLAGGKRGRIISCPAECIGKIGSKISALLQTINLSLSSPPLTQECLRSSKVYLFLLPHTTIANALGSSREKIVGCVVAQRITTAMAIASDGSGSSRSNNDEGGDVNDTNGGNTKRQHLVAVDSGTGLFCHSKPLPTPMGIPRLFVPSVYRKQGIASTLLDAAAATFIHGCPLDPKRGQVAFTQPTGDGKAVMMKWGGGGVRVYEES